MKNLLIAILTLIFTITSCTPNTNTTEEKQPDTITGVVQSIRLSSGKRQSFIITIIDLKGTEHEFSTMEINYNIGDTINVNL
jgi:hypothetical protein